MSLDDAVLRRLISRRVGAGARVSAYDRLHWTPMAEVINLTEEYLGGPLAVYWVEGGTPETFSLPGLDPPVIAFNTRHLELLGALRGTLTAGYLADGLLERVSERLSLRIIAELTLRYGDASAACHLFLESALNRGYYTVPVTMDDLERHPVDELYLAVWCYGLLHECGHISLAQNPDLRPLGEWREEDLAVLIESVVDKMFGDDAVAAREALLGRSARSLDFHVLMEEAQADVIGTRLLFVAMFRILDRVGALTDESAGRLAVESIRMFQLFHYMNECARVARAATVQSGPALRGDDWDVGYNVANNVRLNILTNALATRSAAESGHLDEDKYQQVKAWLIEIVQQSMNPAFDLGHRLAVRLALLIDDRSDDVFDRLTAHISANEAWAATFQAEAAAFVRLAASLGVVHPDLELLADLAATPHQIEHLVTSHLSAFSLAWITGPEADKPLTTSLGEEGHQVVLVFSSDASIDPWLEQVRAEAPPNATVEKVVILAATEHLARATIHRAVGLDARDLTVVFEGSSAFDRIGRELLTGCST